MGNQARTERDEGTTAAPRPPARITFRGVLGGAVRALLDLDFAVVHTVTGLASAPGGTCRDYLLGRRARFTNPAKFAFLTTTVYVAFNQLTNQSDVAAFLDPLLSHQGFWPYVALVLLLPGAGLQRLLFRRREFNGAECYTAGLFVLGELALAATALLALVRFTPLRLPPLVLPALATLYGAWAVTGLYADHRLTVWLRGALVFTLVLGALAGTLYYYQWYRFAGLG